jgi:hypothetical protein
MVVALMLLASTCFLNINRSYYLQLIAAEINIALSKTSQGHAHSGPSEE